MREIKPKDGELRTSSASAFPAATDGQMLLFQGLPKVLKIFLKNQIWEALEILDNDFDELGARALTEE